MSKDPALSGTSSGDLIHPISIRIDAGLLMAVRASRRRGPYPPSRIPLAHMKGHVPAPLTTGRQGRSAPAAEKHPRPEHIPVTIPLTAEELHKRNVDELASLIRSEAEGLNDAERRAVAFTVLNRMRRNEVARVDQVWGAFSHTKPGSDADVKLAEQVLDGTAEDNSQGATHFFTPGAMPIAGNHNAPGYQAADAPLPDERASDPKTHALVKRLVPTWSTSDRFPELTIGGVRSSKFRFLSTRAASMFSSFASGGLFHLLCLLLLICPATEAATRRPTVSRDFAVSSSNIYSIHYWKWIRHCHTLRCRAAKDLSYAFVLYEPLSHQKSTRFSGSKYEFIYATVEYIFRRNRSESSLFCYFLSSVASQDDDYVRTTIAVDFAYYLEKIGSDCLPSVIDSLPKDDMMKDYIQRRRISCDKQNGVYCAMFNLTK
jgi:hypothetical protein